MRARTARRDLTAVALCCEADDIEAAAKAWRLDNGWGTTAEIMLRQAAEALRTAAREVALAG